MLINFLVQPSQSIFSTPNKRTCCERIGAATWREQFLGETLRILGRGLRIFWRRAQGSERWLVRHFGAGECCQYIYDPRLNSTIIKSVDMKNRPFESIWVSIYELARAKRSSFKNMHHLCLTFVLMFNRKNVQPIRPGPMTTAPWRPTIFRCPKRQCHFQTVQPFSGHGFRWTCELKMRHGICMGNQ